MTVFPYPKITVSVNGLQASGRQQITRDSSVPVAVTFYDVTGTVTNPSSATLTLSYLQNSCRTHTDYALTQSGDVWSYTWDSTVANSGPVYGHIASSAPIQSTDFEFRLISNRANREEFGDEEPPDDYSR